MATHAASGALSLSHDVAQDASRGWETAWARRSAALITLCWRVLISTEHCLKVCLIVLPGTSQRLFEQVASSMVAATVLLAVFISPIPTDAAICSTSRTP